MNTAERDQCICDDYKDGMEIHELSRAYGLCERRISQVLKKNNIPRRLRQQNRNQPLSTVHARLGLRLYNFRFNKGIEVGTAANDLGWSIIKLRRIEQGVSEVELLDLMDIAAYTGETISELLEFKE